MTPPYSWEKTAKGVLIASVLSGSVFLRRVYALIVIRVNSKDRRRHSNGIKTGALAVMADAQAAKRAKLTDGKTVARLQPGATRAFKRGSPILFIRLHKNILVPACPTRLPTKIDRKAVSC